MRSQQPYMQGLRELGRVINMIAKKEFFPDNTRSGRFRSEHANGEPAVTAQDSGAETEESYEMPFSERLAGDTDDSNTDRSSDASESLDDDPLDTTTLWDLVEPKYRPNQVQVKPGFSTWMHSQSRVMAMSLADLSVAGQCQSDMRKSARALRVNALDARHVTPTRPSLMRPSCPWTQ